jgi:hypothetical protein
MMLDRATLPDALSHYRRYGYAVVRGVFSRTETIAVAAAFDRHWTTGMAHPSTFRHGNLLYRLGIDPKLGKVVRLVQWPSYADAALEGVRRDPRIFEILEPLLGRDIKQIINQLHWKPPGAASANFAYHQDARFRRPRDAYRNLATSYVQTGIAIDRHDPANGAMLVVPGSHRLGELVIPTPGRILEGSPDASALEAVGLDRATVVELEPGDVALWNVFLVHGSGPNVTSGDRRFYLNGYVRAADCDRGEWAFRGGEPVALGAPTLVHYDDLFERPDPHYIED